MGKTVYLGGPITGLSWEESTRWRLEVGARLMTEGFTVLSPLRSQKLCKGDAEMKASYGPDAHPTVTDKAINRFDLNDIASSDLVFLNFLGSKQVSKGTCVEIGFAYGRGKPIIAVMEADNCHRHAMVNDCCAAIFTNLDEAVEYAISLLKGGL